MISKSLPKASLYQRVSIVREQVTGLLAEEGHFKAKCRQIKFRQSSLSEFLVLVHPAVGLCGPPSVAQENLRLKAAAVRGAGLIPLVAIFQCICLDQGSRPDSRALRKQLSVSSSQIKLWAATSLVVLCV